jgi:hypothetical protein
MVSSSLVADNTSTAKRQIADLRSRHDDAAIERAYGHSVKDKPTPEIICSRFNIRYKITDFYPVSPSNPLSSK